MSKLKKIIITGGAGFIGSALIRYLTNESTFEVLNIDALKYSANLSSLTSVKNLKNYSFIKEDICHEKNILKIISNFKPNIIINLAAESHVDRSIENPLPFINSNILGTFNILNCAYRYWKTLDNKSKNNFLFHQVSTDEVYGDIEKNDLPCDESVAYNPSSPYAASKASSDHLVRSWSRTYDFPVVVTNCSNNYGPFQFPEKFIPHIIISAIKGNKIPIYGNGEQSRDWIHVEDHIKALKEVFLRGKVGETYNIGGNNEVKNIDTAKIVCNFLDDILPSKPLNLNSYSDLIYFVKDRPGHDKRYAINSKKIKIDTGWTARESFETGLKKTIKWYVDNSIWWEKIIENKYDLKRIGKI